MTKNFEASLEEELILGQKELERRKREEETKRIILQQKDVLNQRNPLEIVINTLECIDRFWKGGFVVLNEDYIIRGITRTAKRDLGYRQKHGNPPYFNRPYAELLGIEQKNIFNDFKKYVSSRKKGKETLQRIVVNHKEGGRVHIKSRILGYNIATRNSLYGIILDWSGRKLFG